MMVCEVTGWYEIYWYKNGIKQQKNDTGYERKGMHISTAKLEIRRFTEDDEGLYKCEVNRSIVKWTAKVEIPLKIGKGGIFNLRFDSKWIKCTA